jgi:hypothetical protein
MSLAILRLKIPQLILPDKPEVIFGIILLLLMILIEQNNTTFKNTIIE